MRKTSIVLLSILTISPLILIHSESASAAPTKDKEVIACEKAVKSIAQKWKVNCVKNKSGIVVNKKIKTIYIGTKTYKKNAKYTLITIKKKISPPLKPIDDTISFLDIMTDPKPVDKNNYCLNKNVIINGWHLVCNTKNPYLVVLDAPTKTAFINKQYYSRMEVRDSNSLVNAYIEAVPLPTILSDEQKLCQQNIDEMYKEMKSPYKWGIYCMDAKQMPTINEKYGVAGGMTYGYWNMILINASMSSTHERNVLRHEWGHALTKYIPYDYKESLMKEMNLPWASYSDIHNSVTESFAESYSACSGTPGRNPAYPYMSCEKITKILKGSKIKDNLINSALMN